MAVSYEKLLNDSVSRTDHSDGESSSTSASIPIPKQPRIDSTFHENSRSAYIKLMKTAYMLAVSGMPFTHFRTLVNVQKANGVQMLNKCDNSNIACTFVDAIAKTVRDKITGIIESASAFSLLTDGSQARKTNSEKELVLIRVVRDGKPIFACAALQDIDDYGDADASNIKQAIDDAFAYSKLNIGRDEYVKKLISFTSDGASVNTGIHNGLLTKMRQDDRAWLTSIHCVLHRTELAIKDSLLKVPQFSVVNDLQISLYYLLKQSGKLNRHFNNMADILNVQVYCVPKVHGTRFVSHQRRGLQHLLNNWIVLVQTFEDCIEHSRLSNISAKLCGVLKKLKDYSFLVTCVQYLLILDNVSKMSLTLETEDIIITEVMPAVEKTKTRLDELVNDADDCTPEDLVKPFVFKVSTSVPEPDATYTLEKNLLKRGHKKRKPENREHIQLFMQITGIKHAEKVKDIVRGGVNDLNKCLNDRFSSFKTPLFDNMNWLNPANWVDFDKKLKSVELVAEHFKETLEFTGFDDSKLKREFKDLRWTVHNFYEGTEAKLLWKKIFIYRKSEFPNVCKLVEILLCMGPSNSLVENGFSTLTNMLTDRRLSLSHKNMENLLIIKINDHIWSLDDRKSMIDSAVNSFMSSKRRKMKLDHSPSYEILDKYRQKRQKRKEWYLVSDSDADSDSHSDMSDLEDHPEHIDVDPLSDQESLISTDSENEMEDMSSSEAEDIFQRVLE
ncbi:uncharacterized protein LOC126811174 [Patella vulgata]|uniref:uncharacterized protein LOC126811174 n=1 Tax=Patella vulgata TaxID=6465 RepID=UPI00217FBCE4|nr:uncharacterized protein LOC126811174 [Patella vulgata]